MFNIEEFLELASKKFADDKEFYEFLMFKIQSKMVDIQETKDKNQDCSKEASDIYMLSKLLSMCEGADDDKKKESLEALKEEIR